MRGARQTEVGGHAREGKEWVGARVGGPGKAIGRGRFWGMAAGGMAEG